MTAENGSKKEDITNVTHIDDLKIKRLNENGTYWNIFDQWNTLEIRVAYSEMLTPAEAREYCLLTKYLIKHGQSEAIKIKCKYIYERYMRDQGL